MGFTKSKRDTCQYFFPDTKERRSFVLTLQHQILSLKKREESSLLLCIGTDKITGDCLGPLVGTKLLEQNAAFPLYGTLQNPLHAANLLSMLPRIYRKHPRPFILVVDAAVGPAETVGFVSLSNAPLYPGKGIHRTLPPVGNISVTGIISESGENSEVHLPYTRLYLVNKLADFIAQSILDSNCF